MKMETGADMSPKDVNKAWPMKLEPRASRVLIAGLGNILLRDDGVGVHAIRELQKNPLPGALAVEVGTAVLDALHLFEWADRILAIDAMQAGGSAGTLYSLRASDVEDRSPQASLHELNLLAALRFLPHGKRPPIVILGIEPEIIDFGLALSPKVEAILPLVIHSVKEIVSYWQGETRHLNRATNFGSVKNIERGSLVGGSAPDVG
jgi:hydrogenase maturation protease